MACCLFGTKPLSEPMICCQLDPKVHISMKYYLKFKFSFKKMPLKTASVKWQPFYLRLHVLKLNSLGRYSSMTSVTHRGLMSDMWWWSWVMIGQGSKIPKLLLLAILFSFSCVYVYEYSLCTTYRRFIMWWSSWTWLPVYRFISVVSLVCILNGMQ